VREEMGREGRRGERREGERVQVKENLPKKGRQAEKKSDKRHPLSPPPPKKKRKTKVTRDTEETASDKGYGEAETQCQI
jgi:hypothetical protein